MMTSADQRLLLPVGSRDAEGEKAEAMHAGECKLRRWLVLFRSGTCWYSIGEFIAVDAAGAIECAIAVFGPGEEHQAEEIPWDAAPLPRMNPTATRAVS